LSRRSRESIPRGDCQGVWGVRNRFLRLWLCTQKILIQELIPQLREEGQYRVSITRVCPQLPFDSGLDE